MVIAPLSDMPPSRMRTANARPTTAKAAGKVMEGLRYQGFSFFFCGFLIASSAASKNPKKYPVLMRSIKPPRPGSVIASIFPDEIFSS